MTGEKLLKKVYEILDKHKDEINCCRAVLIEDDLDAGCFGSPLSTFFQTDIFGIERFYDRRKLMVMEPDREEKFNMKKKISKVLKLWRNSLCITI